MSRPDERRRTLARLLNAGGEYSHDELRAELRLGSVRQVRRLLGELRREGIPIRERRESKAKLFSIAEEDRVVQIPAISFTEEQILALAVAAEASRAALSPTPLGAALRQAFDALLKQMSTQVYSFDSEAEAAHWHFGAAPSVALDPEIFRALATAIQDCRRIRIDYFTASKRTITTDRPVEPYGLAVRGGSWLMVGRCLRSLQMRDFSLAGIQKLQLDDEYFIRPDEFSLDEYFRPRFNALSGERFTVRLLVEPDRAPYFHRKKYHPTQRIIESRDDDRIVVGFEVAGLEEIRAWVQSWGIGVTVLEPPELVDRIGKEARELVVRYAMRDN
ncbi:MAG: hypothetical protein JWQ98_571 [Chlorobi bacterium]|nr:hypothetical protein [Chlorobiota bacterium]